MEDFHDFFKNDIKIKEKSYLNKFKKKNGGLVRGVKRA